ncbi:serine/threonine-protein kinase [Singulisphaera sp. Ch08]|uniref:Serine/threonine-protein kinase n=1 Tax=Singulisphaera sp. Ch08 TaxID=3120278 RepID=A0AAU7CBX7_9BACT
MSDQPSESDSVELLVDEYLERYRRGEQPSLTDITEAHPAHAERIRSLILAMLAVEEYGAGSEFSTLLGRSASHARMPQRLGEYLLIRSIGSGGMGMVYEAVQESLGRHVALKTIPSRQPEDATRLERFRREALAAARLQHAHIVPVFGVGEHDGLHFYTMQFIEGHGLDLILREVDRLRREPVDDDDTVDATDGRELSSGLAWGLRHGRFLPQSQSPAESASAFETRQRIPSTRVNRSGLPHLTEARYLDSVAWLGVQVAEALEYAHRQGVLHRDIKPSNLLMDVQGHVWVTDFGLAKTQDDDELTQTGDIVGTLRYMAPERFNGWSDPRSDIFALGATLYELLTFRPAFDEPDRIKLIDRLLHGSPSPLRQLDRRFPRDLETIVLKSLANIPGERYATAGQLAEDLRRFVAGRPILARRSNGVERVWRWCRRNPAGAGMVAIVVAALMATVTMSILYARQQGISAQKVRVLATDLAKQRESLRASVAETRRALAISEFDRGRAALLDEDFGLGLLWMMATWRSAIDANDPDWQRVALANLSAWCVRLPRLKALLSHEEPVEAAAFSPDGMTILTGGDDFTARLWDAASSRPIGDPVRHLGVVNAVAFSPDGKTVLTGSGDGIAQFWDAATLRPLGVRLRHADAILAVAYSPDGRTVLTASKDRTARLWNATTGRPIGKPLEAFLPITAVAFHPEGKVVATASRDFQAQLWNASNGKPIGPPLRHNGEVYAVAFSPDGETLLTGCFGGVENAWEVATGLPIGDERRSHRGHLRGIAFSPDGRTYVTGSQDKSARLWDAATHDPLGPPLIHQGPIVAVAFSPDGHSLLTASSDYTVRVWDTESCRYPAPSLGIPGGGQAVAFRPDGKSFFGANRGGITRLWDVDTGRQVGEKIHAQGKVRSVACSLDGQSVLVGGDPAQLWDVSTTQPRGWALSHPGGADVVAFHPNGKVVVTGGADRTSRFWAVDTGAPIGSPFTHSGTVDAVAFSLDGKTFATGLDGGTARAWDVTTRQPVGEALRHPGAVSALAFSPDGKSIVTGCEDGMARLWDVSTGELRIPPLPHQAWVFAVAFSPDGATVLTGSRDQSARLWDAATGQPIGPPFGHLNHVWAVSFAPDGNSILTGDVDSTARVFAMAPTLPDDLERVARRMEVFTGLRLDATRRFVVPLDNATWRTTRDRLKRSEGR